MLHNLNQIHIQSNWRVGLCPITGLLTRALAPNHQGDFLPLLKSWNWNKKPKKQRQIRHLVHIHSAYLCSPGRPIEKSLWICSSRRAGESLFPFSPVLVPGFRASALSLCRHTPRCPQLFREIKALEDSWSKKYVLKWSSASSDVEKSFSVFWC